MQMDIPGDNEGGFYQWFYARQCGIWDNNRCPVIQTQVNELPVNAPPFLPEPLYGNPKKNRVWFLTLNPGLGEQAEIPPQWAYCPYYENGNPYLNGHELDLPAYGEHFLSWFENCQWSWVKKDYAVRGALSILLERAGQLGGGLPALTARNLEQYRDYLNQVVSLNVVHCKCTGWQQAFLNCPCTKVTCEMIQHWEPRVVYVMGRGAWDFLTRRGCFKKGQLDWGECGESPRLPGVRFCRTYHPGKHNWNREGLFSSAHVRSVVKASTR